VRIASLARRLARPVLVLVGLGVVAYLLHEVGARAVLSSVRALGWTLPIVLVLPYSVSLALDTLAWRLLLPDRHIPLPVLLRARLAGEAVNLVTPTAAVGGEPLKAYLLRPYVPLGEGLASVVMDKTAVVAGQVAFLLGGLGLAASILPPESPLVITMVLLFVVELGAVIGFIVVQTLGVFGGGGRVLGRMGVAPAERYQQRLNALDHHLRRFYRERRGRVCGSALLHAAAWASGAVEIYLVLALLRASPSAQAALVIDAFGAAVKFASFMIPASLGALEGGYIAVFGALGFGGALGLSYTLVRRLRELLWAALGLAWLGSLKARPWLAEEDGPDPSPGAHRQPAADRADRGRADVRPPPC
jgi:glycosyltransferase 2 family protein